MKTGLLIVNLGTPDTPRPDDVGRYLKEFLMDKWVVDIAAPLRWFFVNVLIVPKRKFASSEAYKTIWTKRGSPLLYHLEDLTAKVRRLKPDWQVECAMRYGNPSTESGLEKLKGCDRIVVFPLYPQYAESSTRSSKEEVERAAKKLGLKSELVFIKDFFDAPDFIESFAVLSPDASSKYQHVLMSFHGLPERQIRKVDGSGGHCLASANCCEKMVESNRDCYRAQSYATARALADKLGLRDDQYSVSFQSRLGRTPWIRPFTDEVIPELAKRGVKNLAVVCPSFVADCLETIEEIGDRARELFLKSGGEEFTRIPCPNSSDRWAQGLAFIANQAAANRAAAAEAN